MSETEWTRLGDLTPVFNREVLLVRAANDSPVIAKYSLGGIWLRPTWSIADFNVKASDEDLWHHLPPLPVNKESRVSP